MTRPSQGFSNADNAALVAFSQDLSQGEWAAIALPAGFDTAPDWAAIFAGSRDLGWKARVWSALQALARATSTPSTLKATDQAWDQVQRHFAATIKADENSPDATRRAPATRVASALLQGRGTQQTRAAYQVEVDFGRQQVTAAGAAPLSSDIALLGYGAAITSIGQATEALAVAIGRGPDPSAALSPTWKSVRTTREAIVDELDSVYGELSDWASLLQKGSAPFDHVTALLVPFDELLARSPAPVKAPAAVEPAAPNAPAAAPPAAAAPKTTAAEAKKG